MKKYFIFSAFIIFIFLFIVFTCTQPSGDGGGKKEKEKPKVVTNKYVGAGSYGDIITYEITYLTPDSGTFIYNNKTTGQSGTGTFIVINTYPYSGILEAKLDGNDVDKYYCIEIKGTLAITTIPSGNNKNRIVYALAEKQIITPTNWADDYVWGYYHDGEAENVFDFEGKYGGFTLTNEPYNDRFKYHYGIVPSILKPEDIPENLYPKYFTDTPPSPPYEDGGIGEWEIDLINKLLLFKETEGISPNIGTELQGQIYQTPNSKIFILDQGVGMGFSLGFEYEDNPLTQEQIAGEYKFVGMTFGPDQLSVYGNFEIPVTGDGKIYYHHIGKENPDGELSITNITQINKINNLFKMTIPEIFGTPDSATVYYTVLSKSDGIMMSTTIINDGPNAGNVISIGFGAKL